MLNGMCTSTMGPAGRNYLLIATRNALSLLDQAHAVLIGPEARQSSFVTLRNGLLSALQKLRDRTPRRRLPYIQAVIYRRVLRAALHAARELGETSAHLDLWRLNSRFPRSGMPYHARAAAVDLACRIALDHQDSLRRLAVEHAPQGAERNVA